MKMTTLLGTRGTGYSRVVLIALALLSIAQTGRTSSRKFATHTKAWEADLKHYELVKSGAEQQLYLGEWSLEGKNWLTCYKHYKRNFYVKMDASGSKPMLVWRKKSRRSPERAPVHGKILFDDIISFELREGKHQLKILINKSSKDSGNKVDRRIIVQNELEITRLINLVHFYCANNNDKTEIVTSGKIHEELQGWELSTAIRQFQKHRSDPQGLWKLQDLMGRIRFDKLGLPSKLTDHDKLHEWYKMKQDLFMKAKVEVEEATAVRRNVVGDKGVLKDRRLRCLWNQGWRPEGWRENWEGLLLNDVDGPKPYRDAYHTIWKAHQKDKSFSDKDIKKALSTSDKGRKLQAPCPASGRQQCKDISGIFGRFNAWKPFQKPIWHRHDHRWHPNFEYYSSAKELERANKVTDEYLGNFITHQTAHLMGVLQNYTAERHGVYKALGQFNRFNGKLKDSDNYKYDWRNIDVVTHLAIQVGMQNERNETGDESSTTFKTLYRGVDFEWEKFFRSQRTGGEDVRNMFDNQTMVGRTFFLKSPSSTSREMDKAAGFAGKGGGFLLDIRGAEGLNLQSSAIYKWEAEVLLPMGAVLRIDQVIRQDDRRNNPCVHQRYSMDYIVCTMLPGSGFRLNEAQIEDLKTRGRKSTKAQSKYSIVKQFPESAPIPKRWVWYYNDHPKGGSLKWYKMDDKMQEKFRRHFPKGNGSNNKRPLVYRFSDTYNCFMGKPSQSKSVYKVKFDRFYQINTRTNHLCPVKCELDTYKPGL